MNNPENREHKIPQTQYDDKQNKKHNTMVLDNTMRTQTTVT